MSNIGKVMREFNPSRCGMRSLDPYIISGSIRIPPICFETKVPGIKERWQYHLSPDPMRIGGATVEVFTEGGFRGLEKFPGIQGYSDALNFIKGHINRLDGKHNPLLHRKKKPTPIPK